MMGTTPKLSQAGETLNDPSSTKAEKSKAAKTLGKHGNQHKSGGGH